MWCNVAKAATIRCGYHLPCSTLGCAWRRLRRPPHRRADHLTGAGQQEWSTEDVAYACDLGLVAQDAAGTPRIANPIYAEVVPRHLNYAVQAGLPQQVVWYVNAAGGLDVAGLIAAFQGFFRDHSEHRRAAQRGCSASSSTTRPARSC